MRVLVTGGSGVIGEGLLLALLGRGHTVRLLTRGAEQAAKQWPDDVEAWPGDVTQPDELRGAADGCDAVVHVSGIVNEHPPDVTFEKVNVRGTEHLIAEAVHAGAPRFVYVSSLGADRGTSAYHESKRQAEALFDAYPGSWAIVRPGGVYGPGDEVMSQLLQMHRTLPAVPVIGLGDHRFQPIFFEDLGEALAIAAERDDLTGVYEVAGTDVVTPLEILALLSDITGRSPVPLHVPEPLAAFATSVAESAGLPFPIDDAKLKMLVEHNVIEPPEANALTTVFGVTPTPIKDGLTRLADLQPEQQPADGVGALECKRFWADIHDSDLDAERLMSYVREHCTDLMPVEFAVEPGSEAPVEKGETLTGAIPMRGNIQVRVVEVTPMSFTFATLRGHPLAGVVKFESADIENGEVRFGVTIWARAATFFDWLAMKTVGRGMQDDNWKGLVKRVVVASGGMAEVVHSTTDVCDDTTAARIEGELSELIADQKRETALHAAD